MCECGGDPGIPENSVIGELGAAHCEGVNTTTDRTEGADVDHLLMCRLHAGDQRAAMRLMERHMRGIRRYFANKARRAGDVDALVGGVIRAMLGPGAGLRNARRFAAHLFAVQQQVLRRYYGQGDETRGSLAELGAEAPTWREPGAACNRLLIALRGLPLPHQEVLELLYWEDVAVTELAGILELPIPMAYCRIRAAKAMLLERLGMRAEDDERAVATVDAWGRQIGERLASGRPASR
jgi:DNA-directed RNA polymerase specialized sigma24 family protein